LPASLMRACSVALRALLELSVAQLQGLTECAFSLIRKINVEMGELRLSPATFDL
jgi:hypothetical protein